MVVVVCVYVCVCVRVCVCARASTYLADKYTRWDKNGEYLVSRSMQQPRYLPSKLDRSFFA